MRIRGLSFLGVQTTAFKDLKDFFESVLGLTVKHESPDFVAFIAPDGSRIEVFGPASEWKEEHEHFTTGPVGGFEIDDIHEGKRLLTEHAIELLGDIQGTPGRTQWLHFRAPDGNVYELVHHPDLQAR